MNLEPDPKGSCSSSWSQTKDLLHIRQMCELPFCGATDSQQQLVKRIGLQAMCTTTRELLGTVVMYSHE